MDIRQDPNSIPNFSDGERLGELQAGEPEQEQSSVELDRSGRDGDIPVGSGRDSQLDQGSGATARPKDPPRGAPDGSEGDKSSTGSGAVDGLVGAP